MSDTVHDECTERYQDCMAARKERVLAVIAENPDATKAELAEKAGVDARTIQRARNPRETGVSPPHAGGPVFTIQAIRDLAAAVTSVTAFTKAFKEWQFARDSAR